MPIRHCQKCGLKVLIDESQLSVNPFYCQRCAASAKAAAAKEAGPSPMVSRSVESAAAPSPAPLPAQATAPSAQAGQKPGSIKVLCPYCQASFSGRLPGKPAKGACPMCKKELVLLPDGEVHAATTFDLAKWKAKQGGGTSPAGEDPEVAAQAEAARRAIEKFRKKEEQEPTAEPEEIGRQLNIPSRLTPRGTKIRKAPVQARPEPAPVQDQTLMSPPLSEPADTEPAFPAGLGDQTILDMSAARTTPPSTSRPSASEVDEAFPGSGPTGNLLDSLPDDSIGSSQPPPGGDDEAFPAMGGIEQTMLGMGSSSAPPEPEPEPPVPVRADVTEEQPAYVPPPPPPPIEEAKTPPPAPTEPSPPPPTEPKPSERRGAPEPRRGKGKLVAGVLLMLLPVGGGVAAYFLKDHPQLAPHLEKVREFATKGFLALHERMTRPPAPPPAPPPPPKPKDPPPKEKTPEEIEADRQAWKKELERDMLRLWEAIQVSKRTIRMLNVDPTPDQKKMIDAEQAKVDTKQKAYDEKHAIYEKEFGQKFKPEDLEKPPD